MGGFYERAHVLKRGQRSGGLGKGNLIKTVISYQLSVINGVGQGCFTLTYTVHYYKWGTPTARKTGHWSLFSDC